ncbi:MAG: Na+-translocating ferredoxin:NAD+ oxidoreductase RnfC subunit [Myxococcota bacterium]|jgi:Na+-translocating ferredoxin:NAD+ oxidoreductase RnfC subunit
MPHAISPLDEVRQHEAVLQRALDNWRTMSHEERLEELKEAGILDANGNLAPRHRDDVEAAPIAP